MAPHGLMFHHFHDKNNHVPSQGSISAQEFSKIISLYKKITAFFLHKSGIKKALRVP